MFLLLERQAIKNKHPWSLRSVRNIKDNFSKARNKREEHRIHGNGRSVK
jgi:hypothetical protein